MRSSIAALALASLVLAAGCRRDTDARVDDAKPAWVVDRAALRLDLATHRAQQIERLHAYAQAGAFPHNTTTAPSLHMFRDPGGRLCAVANLVHQDGRDDLVDATARARNDLAIADVHDGPMMDWILASGLTQEELVRIQLPAPPLRAGEPWRSGPQPVAQLPPPPVRALPGAVREAEMDAIVRAHVAAVEAELRASTEASLDLAVARYVASRAASRS